MHGSNHRNGRPSARTGADIVIIGGGAVGVATAVATARAGATVTVLERHPEPGRGCTSSAAGLLNLTHLTPLANPAALRDGLRWLPRRDSPFALRPRASVAPWLARFTLAALSPARLRAGAELLRALGRHSLDLHAQLAEQAVPTGMRRRGIVYACTTEKGLSEVRRHMRPLPEHGIRVDMLNAADAHTKEASLAPTVVGAAYCADEAHLDPAAFIAAMTDEAIRLGVEIRADTEVFDVHRSRRSITSLETTTGQVRGDTVVLAAGVDSRRLAGSLGLKLPLQGAAGYHVDLPTSPADPRQPVYLHEARVVATPLTDRLRLAGTFELGAPDRIDPVRLAAIRTAANHGIHHLADRPVLRSWRGVRPCTPDGLPVLGRPAHIDNLIIGTGHGMVGLVLAPVTAQIIAALAEQNDPGYDLELTSPDRFRLRRPDAGRVTV